MPIDPTNPIVAQQQALQQQLSAAQRPNQADPFVIYKAGEEPRRCHSIDFPAWAAHGWSKNPPAEEAVEEVAEETEQETDSTEQTESTEQPKPATRKKA